MTKAIDVSHHNVIVPEEFPWDLIEAVLIKATEGDDFIDNRMDEHVENALERGKLVYLYHFYDFLVWGRKPKPVDQAEHFLHVTKKWQGDVHGRASDAERGYVRKGGKPYNGRTGTESEDLRLFHKTWHESGWDAHDLLYTNPFSWNTHFKIRDQLKRNDWISSTPYIDGLWIAHWGVTVPYVVFPFKTWFLHQKTNDWRLPGVYTEGTPPRKRGVDGNECAVPAEAWRKMVGADLPPPPPDAEYDRGWNAALDASNASNEKLRR